MKSSPFLLQVMAGGGFPLTEHLMWTSAPITDSWSWGGSVSHFGGSERRIVNTTAENRRNHTKLCSTHLPPSRQSSARRLQPSFGLYTCTSLHRYPPLQTGSKAYRSCQILSSEAASLPFSSTWLLEWDYSEKHGHLNCQTNYTTVSGGKKPNLYIQSTRYTLQLQKLSSQHHLLCLDTRGQQHAGHSHWGGFRRWEGKQSPHYH